MSVLGFLTILKVLGVRPNVAASFLPKIPVAPSTNSSGALPWVFAY